MSHLSSELIWFYERLKVTTYHHEIKLVWCEISLILWSQLICYIHSLCMFFGRPDKVEPKMPFSSHSWASKWTSWPNCLPCAWDVCLFNTSLDEVDTLQWQVHVNCCSGLFGHYLLGMACLETLFANFLLGLLSCNTCYFLENSAYGLFC